MDELGSIRLNQVTVSVEITTGMQMTLMNQIILLILRDVLCLLVPIRTNVQEKSRKRLNLPLKSRSSRM